MTDSNSNDAREEPLAPLLNDSGQPFRLLFVCTGNTCRSPMAHGLAEREAEERGWIQLAVKSAGVATWPGAPASEGARRATARHGIDLGDHRSRPLTPELVEWADLILTMSPSHLVRVEAMGGAEKSEVITRFVADGEGLPGAEDAVVEGVHDPIGGSEGEYETTCEQLRVLVHGIFRRLAPLVSP
ncbi:MAG: low molecular weight protein arginine phosphatase [Gemmatimonadota bacterium]